MGNSKRIYSARICVIGMLVILNFCTFQVLHAQSCNSAITISCGEDVGVNISAGLGSVDFPNSLVNTCFQIAGTGGGESFYKLYVDSETLYQFETTSPSAVNVDYFYKNGAYSPCNSEGWACIGRSSEVAQLAAFELLAMDSIWILANSESETLAAEQSFRITCSSRSCLNRPTIQLSQAVDVFIPAGYGSPTYYNGFGGDCFSSTDQGGGEEQFVFHAPISGVYSLYVAEILAGSNVSYHYRPAAVNPCANTGWSCLGIPTNPGQELVQFYLNEGEEIWLLCNAEAYQVEHAQTFQIDLTGEACVPAQDMNQDGFTEIDILAGFGNDAFVNGLDTMCVSNNGPGGKTRVYRYFADAPGTYNMQVLAADGNAIVEYYYKSAIHDPCSPSGWIPIGFASGQGVVGAIHLLESDSLYILAKSESFWESAHQEIIIDEPVPFACEEFQEVTLDLSTPYQIGRGFGMVFRNTNLPNCGWPNNHGKEIYFQFQPEQAGDFIIHATDYEDHSVSFFYKSADLDICNAEDWLPFGTYFTLTGTDSVWILVKSNWAPAPIEGSFIIEQLLPICEDVIVVNEGVGQWVNISNGLGRQEFSQAGFNNSLNDNWQFNYPDGDEQIYSFTASETGLYAIEILAINSGYVVYNYNYNYNYEDACAGENWSSLVFTNEEGIFGWFDLDQNETIYLLANSLDWALPCSQVFSIHRIFNTTCQSILELGCGTATNYSNSMGVVSNNFVIDVFENCGNGPSNFKGGQIYEFEASVDGEYTLEMISTNGVGGLYYAYKLGESLVCNTQDWTCLGYFNNPGEIVSVYLQAGQRVFWLVGGTMVLTQQTFQVQCVDSNALVINYNASSQICFGANTGFIDLEIEGGVGAISIEWEDDTSLLNTASRTGLHGGIYEVTISDSIGGSVHLDIMIHQFDPIDIFLEEFVEIENEDTLLSIDYFVLSPSNIQSEVWTLNGELFEWGGDNPIVEGLYCLQVDNANGCEAYECISLQVDGPSLLSLFVQTTAVTCHDLDNGSVDLIIEGGLPPYQVNWSDIEGSDNGIDRSDLHAGEYFVVVNDAIGNVSSTFFTITEPAPLTLELESSSSSHPCINDGAVQIPSQSIPENAQILWSTGSHSSHLYNRLPGEYCVVMSTSSDCQVSGCIEVDFDMDYNLQLVANVYEGSCAGANDGVIEIFSELPCGPLSFHWSHLTEVEYSGIATNLANGSYSCVITDENGISETLFFELYNDVAPLDIDVALTFPTSLSPNAGGVSLSISGGSPPFTIYWTDVEDGQGELTVDDLTQGTYCYSLYDSNFCFAADCITLNQIILEPLVITSEVINPTCHGLSNGSIALNIAGGMAPYTVNWQDSSDANGQTLRNNLQGGEYTIVVLDSLNNESSITVDLIEPPVLEINSILTDSSTPISSDGSIVLVVNGAQGEFLIDWLDLTTGDDTLIRSELLPGEYCLNITDTSDCMIEACFNIAFIPAESISISHIIQNNSCYDDSDGLIEIEVSGGYEPLTIDWLDIVENDGLLVRDNLLAGTYEVQVTDIGGGVVNQIFEVQQPDSIEIQGVVTDLTDWENHNGSILISVEGGTQPYVYNWLDLPSAIDPMNRFNLIPASYCLTVTDSMACENTFCFIVNNNDVFESQVDSELFIYPNPCRDKFFIGGDHHIMNWQLIDALGKVVLTGVTSLVDCRSIASGYYHIQIQTADSRATFVLLKEGF